MTIYDSNNSTSEAIISETTPPETTPTTSISNLPVDNEEEIKRNAEEKEINRKKNEKELLEKLAASFNGHAGNTALMKSLDWLPERYWSIRDSLVNQGKLMLARGKGGAVRLVKTEAEIEAEAKAKAEAAAEVEAEIRTAAGTTVDTVAAEAGTATAAAETAIDTSAPSKEKELYPIIVDVIETSWVKDLGFDNSCVEITAMQGKRLTGGKWTRPDIVLTGVKNFIYLHRRVLDIVTL
jgi:hypothetical protein